MSNKHKQEKRVAGPCHSYGLRHVGDALWVVVRVEGTEEKLLSRPEERGLAVAILADRVEQDGWEL